MRLADAERGSLPARCARTGQRCLTRFAAPVRHVARPLEWLTWTGVWPLGRLRDDPPARPVVLPLLPGRHRWRTGLASVRDVSAAAVPIAAVVALASDGVLGGVAGALLLPLLLVHLLVGVLGITTTVELRLDHTGTWLRLRRVHPEFVAAIESTLVRPANEPHLAPPAASTTSRVASAADE